MSWNGMISIHALMIGAFSIYFDYSPHPQWMIAAVAGYIASHWANRSASKALPPIQHALLVLLHWTSGTSWCLPLYIAHWGRTLLHSSLRSSDAVFLLLTAAFAAVSSLLRPLSAEAIAAIVFGSLSLLAFARLFRKYLTDIEKQKQVLTIEKKHLSTHDALTGLINYEEFHRRLELLVEENRSVLLVLMDCKDLKSHNTTTGFEGVNHMLKQAAQMLRIMFPSASFISRVGGDEFALVFVTDDLDDSLSSVKQLLASEFPKLTGLEITFGIASRPNDGVTKDDLILVAERNLYTMKRESWLKREEHMLRSEKLRVVGELASGMAHEIRNPLTTIKGFLQLSKAGQFNIEPWYELIMDEINRMSMLTAEFLQFSKPHVSQYRVHSIGQCIQRVISLLDSEVSRLGHQIVFEPADEPLNMLMDQDKMLQLLLNLVKNALEAMPEQGVVTIRLYSSEEGLAVIEVADTGMGIPEKDLDKIFVPFYTTKDSGTGLGLSICHKIVQDHEGRIEVESEAAKGTKFTITLPLAEHKEDIAMHGAGASSSEVR